MSKFFNELKVSFPDQLSECKHYTINTGKIARGYSWEQLETFKSSLKKIFQPYLENNVWFALIVSGNNKHWASKNYGSWT